MIKLTYKEMKEKCTCATGGRPLFSTTSPFCEKHGIMGIALKLNREEMKENHYEEFMVDKHPSPQPETEWEARERLGEVPFNEAEECCDGECNHDDCCGKIPENCTHNLEALKK